MGPDVGCSNLIGLFSYETHLLQIVRINRQKTATHSQMCLKNRSNSNVFVLLKMNQPSIFKAILSLQKAEWDVEISTKLPQDAKHITSCHRAPNIHK